MPNIAYYRVSTADPPIEAQRHALLAGADFGAFDRQFKDDPVSGATPAAQRPGFAKLLAYVRAGDTLHVYAVDRLGRDALDVQATLRSLLQLGVAVEVRGLGRIDQDAGALILAVLAQVADMQRERIIERTAAGRAKARESLAATGLTHRGKKSLGRPSAAPPTEVRAWRLEQGASISATAAHWGVSRATVKRYCAAAS